MLLCPCGSQNIYATCCGLYLDNQELPQSPEQLMRSRYTAYSLGKIDYIKNTMKGKALIGFNALNVLQWAKNINWIDLTVIKSSLSNKRLGFVEFIARFSEGNQVKIMHELSEFHRENGRWYYVSGKDKSNVNKIHTAQVTRNAPCSCGSGKKFKNCHLKT